ncbi:NFACT family protein [Candidatus Micrarchaeota archaeon]|nr:NFACT family protein [Candidatus Micrarchaeota archaeon]
MVKKSFQAMSNLDLFYLLRELNALEGARLAKAYGFAPDAPGVFRFKFNTAAGEKNLHVDLNAGLWLTKYLKEAPKQPDAFVVKLRKDLDNAILVSVKQINFDRLVSLEFSSKVGKRILVVEFVGDGNLILLGEDDKIIQVSESRSYAARKLRAGARYAPPPSMKKNPRDLAESDLRELMGGVVSALFKKIDLSPFYLEEACARVGIALDEKIRGASVENRRALAGACGELLREELSPRVYEREGRVFAFAPFELKKAENASAKEFKSFSEALDAYFESVEVTPAARGKNAEVLRFEKELRGLQDLAEGQERAAKAFDATAGEKKAGGDWIKANADLVERAVGEAKSVKLGGSVEAVENRLAALGEKFKRVKLEGAEVVLEIGED